jgi:anti-sigma factor RsiW
MENGKGEAMDCRESRERLTAFHDGELPPAEAETMAQHVASCPACASELDDLRGTVALLDAWELEPGPPLSTPEETAERALADRLRVARPDAAFPLRLWITAGVAGAVIGFLLDLSQVAVTAPEEGR